MRPTSLGGSFTFANTSLTVNRMGYGAMQLAGPQVWGPPRDPDEPSEFCARPSRPAQITSIPNGESDSLRNRRDREN
jgi:hypothetical protein